MPTWTDVYEGGLINTSEVLLKAYEPLTDLTLSWPNETALDTDVLADINEINAIQPGVSIILPDARLGGEGSACLFWNIGSVSIDIVTATSVAVGTLEPGLQYFLYLSDGTTESGTWRLLVFGAGISVAQSGQLASPSLVSRGGTLVQATPVTNLSSSYTIGLSDQATLLQWTGGVGTLTLDNVGTLGNGFFCHVRNSGDGALTVQVTPASGSTIDSSNSVTFNAGESAIIVCDGTNFVTISRLASSGSSSFTYLSIDISGTGSTTLSAAQQGKTVYRMLGALTGNRTIVFPNSLAQFTVRNETTGSYTLTIKTATGAGVTVDQNTSALLYCDGSDIKQSVSTVTPASVIPITQGGTGATSASNALTNLGATSLGKTLIQAATAAIARAAIGIGSIGDTIFTATTNLRLPSGTAAAPMYGFSGDATTGMFLTAAGHLSFSVSGAEALRIDPNFTYTFVSGVAKEMYHAGNFTSGVVTTALGYTPVRQDTGDTIKIGYTVYPYLTVNSTAYGRIWTDGGTTTNGTPVAGSGYCVFPNGMKVMWGSVATAISGGSTIFFPTSFVAAPVVTANATSGGVARLVTVGGETTISFFYEVTNPTTGAASTSGFNWIAVGF